MIRALTFAALLCLTGCGQSSQQTTTQAPVAEAPPTPAPPEIPAVDEALLQAPNSAFVAIEPTEIGIIGAPDIREAIAPLISVEALSEGEAVQLSVRESGDDATADVVRSGLADDSVGAGHVRIEFRREPEGWFPTNAYRRHQCRRGAQAGAWTTEACP